MRKLLLLTMLCVILFCNRNSAQECRPSAAGLIHLKEALDSNYHDSPGIAGFRFRRIILEAACASNEKDKDIVRRKIGLMWQRFSQEPVCPDGSMHLADLIPYAFSIRYQRLMLPVANEWELGMNFLDESQRTVLDHLDDAIAATKDTSTVNMLNEYREIYMAAGARRYSEFSFYTRNLISRFDAVRRYAYGLYPVQKKGKWGWVNYKGITIIPLRYAAVRYFVKDLFEVSDDGVNFYYVDQYNKRVDGPWQEQLPPWTGQPLKKKANINGQEITIFLSPDTLHQSDDARNDEPETAYWYKAGADLVGFGYRDLAGTPYGIWKYYQLANKKWELYCEGHYTMVKVDKLVVDPDIEKSFPFSSTAEAKEDFIKDLNDRLLFTGEWRFYAEGRLDRILVLDDKATIPYMISESEEGTLSLLRHGQIRRMSGGLLKKNDGKD